MKKQLCTLSLFLASLIAFSPLGANAEDVIVGDNDAQDGRVVSVTLQWDSNPEKDIAGYNVYWGRASGEYLRVLTVTTTTATIGVKGTKTLYFAVTAFNTSDEESDFSMEIHYP
jgi:hypothetical protein